MTEHTLRIGSRKSELALEQTYIIERLFKRDISPSENRDHYL